ncbi:pentatricopeptide repeat-containing protein At4g16390, chloroplastic [Humulus lupulus]|uniref:pentatricopeptide repeat-containing protein At4g16390, chloroplastic n=1 Tax=Humulus lupulus TaxID=3486 RepID=UPI002B40582A|nr:pentatricopeptide repeat-containing protein At4g16390, chloroplastic [Humulus lupulus]
MAYSLCSSPSPIVHERHSLSLSLSSPRNPRIRNFNHLCKLNFLSSQYKTSSLQVSHVSVHDPVTEETKKEVVGEAATTGDPNGHSGSSSKSYIWVNPRSPRAPQLRKKSYHTRYTNLVEVAESLNSCSASEDEVLKVLGTLSGKLLEQDAVVILNNMVNAETAVLALKYFQQNLTPEREVILYNVTLKVFRKCKNLAGAEKLFDEMLNKGIKPDNVTFSTMISCARMSSLPEKAVEWFEKMSSFGCDPDDVTYSAMIDAYGRAGNVDMAFSLYDRARTEKWRIDRVTFSTLIRIYGQSGNYDGCLNVFEEMKAIGVKPNVVVYNTLLDAMGRAKRPWQAKKIYQEMISSGFAPSFVTYAALLRAFGRSRYGDDCVNVYKEMKEKGMKLNVILYNTILSMCADLGYTDEAISIFEDLKSSETMPDSWTFSSMITIYSCSGQVPEAEAMFNEMLKAGFAPNIFVLTSLIQCYGKAKRIDDVVKTFDQLLELGISPDERFCGCLLNVMTQTPKEELSKLTACIEKAYPKLGYVVNLLLEDDKNENFKNEASELFETVGADVRKAYCNCLIDLSMNLDLLDRACELLDLGVSQEVYTDIQSRSPSQWSLNLKGLSLGAALTALHVWINDLSKELESGEELPPLLGINTGHGKHKYSDKGFTLAGVFDSHLKELNAPFHEAPDNAGWFLTTKVAAKSWLESRKSSELVAA